MSRKRGTSNTKKKRYNKIGNVKRKSKKRKDVNEGKRKRAGAGVENKMWPREKF